MDDLKTYVKWLPIESFTPPVDKRVLVVCRTAKAVKTVNIGYFDGNGVFHGMGSSAKVTHWCLIPELPEVC